ncbi:TetR/AcrR family transcriptional regulator [Sphingobacterium lumbrici]|uniref:TetR/AcrR family transcriptional regulator n=1 Tax=Sphingobacterium lumbrici TaxID=2559600 RepID=UPI001128E27D|nr:TetR/AcrR family transcriptional regulator [Sphingobacterium lumbrici]
MLKSADEKRIKILESAKRRFAHYGMSKTTMAEIANDLSFSKALLYYYFPDKNSLYCAVLDYVIKEQEEDILQVLKPVKNTEKAIMLILEKRMEYIKRYYNLFEYTFNASKDVSEDLGKVIICSFEKQHKQIISILKNGGKSGELVVDNYEETARLLLFSLMGMRLIVIKDLKHSFFSTKEEFDAILEMQKKMAKIFIKGLCA